MLVFALEAAVFNIPTTRSEIVSIVKVDSTGRGQRPAPTTAVVRAFVGYFADPSTRPTRSGPVERVWVHLFARSQGQYLFPGSSEWEGKKVLSPEKLCKWWKTVLGGVSAQCAVDSERERERLWWVIPGLDEEEALQALGELHAGASHDRSRWTYGHPYSQTEIPLPYTPAETPFNLGHFIPSFDDDPKTRFLDEIACTTQVDGVMSPKKKRAKTSSKQNDASSSSQPPKEEEEKEERPHGELGKVRPDEFWERMSFRQECISGALTGFFVAVFPWSSTTSVVMENNNPLAPQAGEVSFQMIRRIIISMHNTDFSTLEGAIRGTEILENAIRGMCEGTAVTAVSATTATTRLEASDLPPPRLDRRTPEPETTVRRDHLGPPAVATHDDVSPNPFPEPVPSTDTYHSYIYGSITIDKQTAVSASASSAGSGATSSTNTVVTKLAVRKKVKNR